VENPFLKRNQIRLHGQKAEKRTAKRLAGRQTPGSGSLDGAKGDIELPEFLVENKATEFRSMVVKYDWLQKISREALAVSKEPALAFQFVTKDGKPIAHDAKWIMMPERCFLEILENRDRES